ncbi:Uncharacterized protein APZ42_015030 [Daphnia magna]|uniref:Uncharacterized protein n=1 Tax=Daphnia magna TaxID=35525 RepID=A0A162P4F7_9CRUS|nr:Uncharacterized protein APZ42_015030 [Daphnia magna]
MENDRSLRYRRKRKHLSNFLFSNSNKSHIGDGTSTIKRISNCHADVIER